MFNYKKLIALSVAALAILFGLAKIRTSEFNKLNSAGCIESCSSFAKADDFSIVNILSVKFR